MVVVPHLSHMTVPHLLPPKQVGELTQEVEDVSSRFGSKLILIWSPTFMVRTICLYAMMFGTASFIASIVETTSTTTTAMLMTLSKRWVMPTWLSAMMINTRYMVNETIPPTTLCRLFFIPV